MLSTSEKHLIQKVKEEYEGDQDIQRLISILEYEADPNGEPDIFFAKQFDRYLNGNCHNMEKGLNYIRDNMHRYLQGEANKYILKFIRIFGEANEFVLRYIKTIGDENNRYDGRNEYTIKQLMKIKKLCDENDVDLF